MLMAIGRAALQPLEARTRWVEADLRDPEWPSRLPAPYADVVLSTTALHWFPSEQLGRVYAGIAARLRPGGWFLNGDHMAFAPNQATLSSVIHRISDRDQRLAEVRPGAEDWDRWWARVRAQPDLGPLMAERDRRFPQEHGREPKLTVADHAALLRTAGFAEVGVVWQEGENRVLAAIR